MIKVPLPQIIEKIKESAGLTEEEIKKKINEKMDQLSGLISEEGAAHIISNELGIKLFEEVPGKLQIKNILAGMRDVEMVGKVQQIYPVNEFQKKDGSSGKVVSMVVADETGTIRVVLWGGQTDLVKELKEGDTVKVISGYTKENNNRLEIHMGERSKLEVNPEGEVIGEVKQALSTRKKISELNENDNDVEVLGTIVQVFEPRFFEVCPECNKRIRQRDEGFFCEAHKVVTPIYSYVLNATIDDGSDTIRGVFFRKQAENLLEMEHEKILEYKDAPEKFEEVKTNLLGNIIKIVGRTNKNELFDRLEFVSRLVFPKADPKEEIERLKAENSKDVEPTEAVEASKVEKEVKQTEDKPSVDSVVESSSAEEITESPQKAPKTEQAKDDGEKLPSFEDI